MSASRQAIIAQAQAWLGKNEADGSFREIIDTYNSHSPLARGYEMSYSDEWCAAFVSAVAIKCGATDIMPTECGCERMIDRYAAIGCWDENDARVPAPGELIFYEWQDAGNGDNTGWADHVGIVENVSGDSFTVIEGNNGSAVRRRMMGTNGLNIRGFAVPNFDNDNAQKSNEEIAQEVINGDWGNGQERKDRLAAAGYDYTAVQRIVNTLV